MRQLFLALCLTAITLATPFTAAYAGEKKLKVVYHVSEIDRVGFALNNMRNHIKGVGGPENVELVIVAHGPALEGLPRDGCAAENLKARDRIAEDERAV